MKRNLAEVALLIVLLEMLSRDHTHPFNGKVRSEVTARLGRMGLNFSGWMRVTDAVSLVLQWLDEKEPTDV